jgi:hypothetical protein
MSVRLYGTCNDGGLDHQTKRLGAQFASALMTSLRVKKAVLYCESRPVRKRSIATSLSAFQNKKLGSFSPHWMYGTTK